MSKQTKAQPVRRTTGKPAEPSEFQFTQREKFIQAAREAGCDETGEALDEALRTIGKARKRT